MPQQPDPTAALRTAALQVERAYAEQARLAEERTAAALRRARRAEEKLKRLATAPERLVAVALAFLECIEDITTMDFSYGADRKPRDALRSVLAEIGATTPRPDTWEWDHHMAELHQAAADAAILGDDA